MPQRIQSGAERGKRLQADWSKKFTESLQLLHEEWEEKNSEMFHGQKDEGFLDPSLMRDVYKNEPKRNVRRKFDELIIRQRSVQQKSHPEEYAQIWQILWVETNQQVLTLTEHYRRHIRERVHILEQQPDLKVTRAEYARKLHEDQVQTSLKDELDRVFAEVSPEESMDGPQECLDQHDRSNAGWKCGFSSDTGALGTA